MTGRYDCIISLMTLLSRGILYGKGKKIKKICMCGLILNKKDIDEDED